MNRCLAFEVNEQKWKLYNTLSEPGMSYTNHLKAMVEKFCVQDSTLTTLRSIG